MRKMSMYMDVKGDINKNIGICKGRNPCLVLGTSNILLLVVATQYNRFYSGHRFLLLNV